MKKKIIFFFLIIIIIIFFLKNFQNTKKILQEDSLSSKNENNTSVSNIIRDVNYASTDNKGNQYIINAEIGEIDLSNADIIYLTNVKALIKLIDKDNVSITSDYGKYNIITYDSIFTNNVIAKYIDNKITGEYLDFSINRNSMIISKNVIYTNNENILKADVVEMNLETKDTKIFMYDNKKKVKVKNKNKNGNN
jgi:hypothetical protein